MIAICKSLVIRITDIPYSGTVRYYYSSLILLHTKYRRRRCLARKKKKRRKKETSPSSLDYFVVEHRYRPTAATLHVKRTKREKKKGSIDLGPKRSGGSTPSPPGDLFSTSEEARTTPPAEVEGPKREVGDNQQVRSAAWRPCSLAGKKSGRVQLNSDFRLALKPFGGAPYKYFTRAPTLSSRACRFPSLQFYYPDCHAAWKDIKPASKIQRLSAAKIVAAANLASKYRCRNKLRAEDLQERHLCARGAVAGRGSCRREGGSCRQERPRANPADKGRPC